MSDFKGQDQRKDDRVLKNFTVIYFIKNEPHGRADLCSIKDISKGGLRFVASRPLKENDELLMELRIPYVVPRVTPVEGKVIGVKEMIKNVMYEVRVSFTKVDTQAQLDLDLVEKKNKGA